MNNCCIAAIQMVSGESVSENLTRAYQLLRQSHRQGASLALLPENFAHLSDRGSYPAAEPFASDTSPDPSQQPIQSAVSRWAKELGMWLVAGAVPLSNRPDGVTVGGQRTRSACLVYDDLGRRQARYDKMHLFDVDVADAAGRYRESASIEPGTDTCVVTSPWANLGLSICFDLRFPELYRKLALGGAEVLFVPAAFTHTTGKAHWKTLLRARAIENGCFVIAANQGGEHSAKRRTWGHSMIIDPWGNILAEAGEGEQVISARLDAEKLVSVRRDMPLLSMRRL